MTIHVVTTEHGTKSFDANDWDTCDKAGELWVGDQETQVGVAQFAKGAWQFVYETNDEEPEVKPREWSRVGEIPEGITARSAKGCLWKDGMWSSAHARSNGYGYDNTGPFTEVLDGTEPFAGNGDDA